MKGSMPLYRIYRLKENLRQQFRWQPHLSGITAVKPKDYDESFEVDAETPYAAWHLLRASGDELKLGDLLANEAGQVSILKYIGFEEARWVIPEPKQVAVTDAAAAPGPTGPEISASA